jgi:hypothetical protein
MADDGSHWVSVAEAARLLGVTDRQARHLADKGALPCKRVRLEGARQGIVAVDVGAVRPVRDWAAGTDGE